MRQVVYANYSLKSKNNIGYFLAKFLRFINSVFCWILVFSLTITPPLQAALWQDFQSMFSADERGKAVISFPYVPEVPATRVSLSGVKSVLGQAVLDGKGIFSQRNRICVQRIGHQEEEEEELERERQIFNIDFLLQEIWGLTIKNPYRELAHIETLDDTGKSVVQRLVFLLTNPDAYVPFDNYVASQQYDAEAIPRPYFEPSSFQRHCLASLLLNPREASEKAFVVDRDRCLYSDGAYQNFNIPFEKVRADRDWYQLATCNALYISEFHRINREDRTFMSDEPFDATIINPFLVRAPEEVLLGWLSHKVVRNSVTITGDNRAAPLMFNSFIQTWYAIRQAWQTREERSDPLHSPASLLRSLQEPTWMVYYRAPEPFRTYLLPSFPNTLTQIYEGLRTNPPQSTPERMPALERYKPYQFFTSVSGGQAFELLLLQILNPWIEHLNAAESESIASLLNAVAQTTEERCSRQYELRPVVKELNPEDKGKLGRGMFRFLNSGRAGAEAFQWAARLGFPINEPGETGYTLLQEAVRRHSCETVFHLHGIDDIRPQVRLDTESVCAGDEPQTALDLAIERDEAVFKALIQIGAGSGLKNPRRALESYRALQQANLLDESLRNAFKILAQRHQEFRWLVVLEEVFPQVQAKSPAAEPPTSCMTQEPSINDMLQEIELIYRQREEQENKEKWWNIEIEVFNQILAGNPTERRREQARRGKIKKLLKVAERNGIPIKRDFHSSVEAAVHLGLNGIPRGLTPERREQFEAAVRQINEHIFNECFTEDERVRYRQHADNDSEEHLLPAMQLTAVQRVLKMAGQEPRNLPQTLFAYMARPLLFAYLGILDEQLRETETFREFRDAFFHNRPTQTYEGPILEIFNRVVGSDEQPEPLLENAVRSVYEKLTKQEQVIDMADNGLRRFRPEIRERLMPGGIFSSKRDHGLCAVRPIGLGAQSLLGSAGVLFIKKYPQMPGLEAAVSRLMLGIGGCGAPYSDLVNIEGVPYLVSQGFGGENSQNLLQRLIDEDLIGEPSARLQENFKRSTLLKDLSQLDRNRATLLALMSMLVSPEDGKLDNFVLVPLENDPEHFELVSIDNDHAFVNPIGSRRTELATGAKKRIQTNSIIFGLRSVMMDTISDKVRQVILGIQPEVFISKWLQNLQRLDAGYDRLFPNPDQRTALREEFYSCIGIPLSDRMVMGVYDRLVFMQKSLRKPDSITPAELLKSIMSPLASPARYGRFWTNASAGNVAAGAGAAAAGTAAVVDATVCVSANDSSLYEVLIDPEIREFITSSGSAYQTSTQLPLERSVDAPLEDRLRDAQETLRCMNENIVLTERIVQDSSLRTAENLRRLKHSQYQKQRFLRGFDFGSRPRSEQRDILHILQDPGSPLTWLELKNCSVLEDGDFHVAEEPNGDERKFVLRNLCHLSVEGCEGLSPGMLQHFLEARKPLGYLDISRTRSTFGLFPYQTLTTSLKTLKMSGLHPNNVRTFIITGLQEGRSEEEMVITDGVRSWRRRTVEEPPALQVLEIDGMTESAVHLINVPKLRSLSLRNMRSLNDRTLDQLLFRVNARGAVVYTQRDPDADHFDLTTERVPSPNFPDLETLEIRGTRVTLPTLRMLLPKLDSATIFKVEERIGDIAKQDPATIIRQFRVDTDHILSSKGFFRHTVHFLKNVTLGIAQDIWDFCRLVVKIHKWRTRHSQGGELPDPASPEVLSRVRNTEEIVRNVGSAATAVLRTADIPATVMAVISTAGTAVKVIPVVGWSVSGAWWLGRAAYTEHKRVQHNIQLAQVLAGQLLRAALINLGEDRPSVLSGGVLNLQGRGLGDRGVLELFAPEAEEDSERSVNEGESRNVSH